MDYIENDEIVLIKNINKCKNFASKIYVMELLHRQRSFKETYLALISGNIIKRMQVTNKLQSDFLWASVQN